MNQESNVSIESVAAPKEFFVECPHCKSQICYKQDVNGVSTLTCMSCGFTTSELMADGSETEVEVRKNHPNLYKDLRFVDEHGYVWYPSVVTVPGVGMAYVDGSSAENWEWVVTPMQMLTRRQRRQKHLSADQKWVAVPSKTIRFGKDGFPEALAALGLFE